MPDPKPVITTSPVNESIEPRKALPATPTRAAEEIALPARETGAPHLEWPAETPKGHVRVRITKAGGHDLTGVQTGGPPTRAPAAGELAIYTGGEGINLAPTFNWKDEITLPIANAQQLEKRGLVEIED